MVRIEKAIEIAMHLTQPDSTLPKFGDIDNARSSILNPHILGIFEPS